MFRNSLFLFVFAIAGCTSISPESAARLETLSGRVAPTVHGTGSLKIVDQREPKAKDAKLLIAWTGGFSCINGITQLGDDKYGGDRLARLENAIATAFPDTFGAALVVRRYDIYVNRGAEADAIAWGAAMGSVGIYGAGGTPGDTPVIWRAPKCSQADQRAGWFDKSDLVDNSNPLTVDIDITFLERQYKVNAAISSELDGKALERLGWDSTPAYEALVQAAMERANERLVASMKSGAGSSD